MVDEADKSTRADADHSPTPHAPGGPAPPYDRTIKLDRSIAERDPTVPARFGRYEVLGRIGIGGFASVFSARDPELDAPVAIKVLAENHSADVEVRKRFVAEARVARRLGSDRLIGVFDLGETDDGRPFVVMELASGGTLRARLTRTGRPTHEALLRLVDELGACMIAIHAKDVVHRDIKPSNLLIRPIGPPQDEHPTELIAEDERLVLADFGLARDISDGASAVTVGGGTAGYMAPEQADPKGRADFRADIYAATVVVAELTTGRHPERLDLGTADLAPSVREALAEGLSIDREQRPPSAVAWRDRLLAAFRDDAPTRVGHERTDGDHTDDSGAPVTDRTATMAATKIQAPYPYGNESDEYDLTSFDEAIGNVAADPDSGHEPTEVYPTSDPAPIATSGPSVDDGPPPPPPSIPLNPRVQPPPPGQEFGPQAGRLERLGPGNERPPNHPGGSPAEPRGPVGQPQPAGGRPPATAVPDGEQRSQSLPGPPASQQPGAGQHQPSQPAAGQHPPSQSGQHLGDYRTAGQHPPSQPAAGQHPPSQTGQQAPSQPAAGQRPPSQTRRQAPSQPAAGHYPPSQPGHGHYPAVQPPASAANQPASSAGSAPSGWPPAAGPAAAGQPVAPPPPVAAAPQTLTGTGQPVARLQPPSPAERRQLPPPGPGQGQGQPAQPGQPVGNPPGPRGTGAVRAGRTLPNPGGPPVPGRSSGGPVPPRAGPAVVEPRSRRQAKLEDKAIRKDARRRRRRRRRRRISNVIRAVIRGVLAALLTALIGTIVLAAATDTPADRLPQGAETLVNLAMFTAFFIGLRAFPWPRRLDPDG